MRRWPVLLLLAGAVLFLLVRPDRFVSYEELLAQRATLREAVANHRAAALALYAATYIATASLAIPGGLVLTLAGGMLFGTALGGLTAAASATAGGTVLFLLARTVLRTIRLGRAEPIVGRLRQGFRQGAAPYMLFLRLSPWIPFWLVNIAAGGAGVRPRTFIWTTALGILPITLVVAGAGQNFDRIAAASAAALESCRRGGGADCRMQLPFGEILSPESVALLIGGSLLALAPKVLHALRSRMSPFDT